MVVTFKHVVVKPEDDLSFATDCYSEIISRYNL